MKNVTKLLTRAGILGASLVMAAPAFAQATCPCFDVAEILEICDQHKNEATADGGRYIQWFRPFDASCRLERPDGSMEIATFRPESGSECVVVASHRNVGDNELTNRWFPEPVTSDQVTACLAETNAAILARGARADVNDPEQR